MKERILAEIKKIEVFYDVKVLFAVESGSRAWGFPSKNSDYDVRFIYVHQKDWYLSIDEKRDVIECPINDDLDMSGWELRKALKLFRKSNPPLMEWLHSQMVYYETYSLVQELSELENQFFSPKASIYHYLQMAKRNYRDFHQRDTIKIKKYFYILRPILACKWIEKYLTIPPVEFQLLLEDSMQDSFIKQEILLLLQRKEQGSELEFEPKQSILNQYIENELVNIENFARGLNISSGKEKDGTDKLNDLFRKTLNEVWD